MYFPLFLGGGGEGILGVTLGAAYFSRQCCNLFPRKI